MLQFFAILNITHDSFSDGGLYLEPKQVITRLDELDCCKTIYAIDVGFASTRPEAKLIYPQNELEIFEKYISIFRNFAKTSNIKLSLDTYNYEVAKLAVKNGFSIINDVSGLQDERFVNLIASDKSLQVVFMHNLGVPANRNIVMKEQNNNLLVEISNFASLKIARMLDKGILLENIIFDPGIGFGKTSQQGLFIMKNILELKSIVRSNLNLPTSQNIKIMIGHSRKTILRDLSGYKLKGDRDIDNPILDNLTKLTTKLILYDCDFIRIHDVD